MWQRRLGLDLEVPDGFGNWLAGFTDGEGCFDIHVNSGDSGIKCRFGIALRDDDVNILYQVKESIGVGTIRKAPVSASQRPGACNQARWTVQRASDIVHVIIPLFEKYSLRTKKRRDFALWARAARIVHAGDHHTKEGREEVLRLKHEMEEGRKYQAPGW